jgi:hypothetical protein
MELTVFDKAGGACTKRIALEQDQIISDGSACAISRGRASRLRVGERAGKSALAVFDEVVAGMTSDQALSLGRLSGEIGEHATVVTERRRKEQPQPGVISRTQEFLWYAPGEPALMLIDFDRKGMPAAIEKRLDEVGGAWNALARVIPGLVGAGRISRASTSAGIYNADTGQRFSGSGGEHHYVMVADGSDIPRALSDLHDRAWLNGLGWFTVGSAGQLLERSIVDRTVGSPKRLVFEGAPVMVPPLAQDQSVRQPTVTEGETIDTRAVIPPLTSAERDIVKSRKEAARRQLQPAADRVRVRSDRELAEQISKETGMHAATALRHVTARHAGKLMPSTPLEFDDTEIGTVTVGDILHHPDCFVGETLADPLEGIAYGRCKAMVMRRDDGELFIHSFAHGRTFYDLVLDVARMRQEIDAAPLRSAVDVLVANLFRAHLEPDELAELREYVAKRAGVGVRQIDQRIKATREVRAKKEAERAAAVAPSDGRITFPVPADDAEMTAVMERIDRVLSQVKDAEPPMRNASGAFCEIRERPFMMTS